MKVDETWKPIISSLPHADLLFFLLILPTQTLLFFFVALRPRRRDGLLGTGTEWEGDDRVKARPRKPPEKDRRDRGPPPEQ